MLPSMGLQRSDAAEPKRGQILVGGGVPIVEMVKSYQIPGIFCW